MKCPKCGGRRRGWLRCPKCGGKRFAVTYAAVVDAFVQDGAVQRVVCYGDIGPPQSVQCVDCFQQFSADHPAAAIAESADTWPSWEIE